MTRSVLQNQVVGEVCRGSSNRWDVARLARRFTRCPSSIRSHCVSGIPLSNTDITLEFASVHTCDAVERPLVARVGEQTQ